jgi:hypothetical protein
MIEIKLNFINNSSDINNSQIVIFQRNVAPAMLNDGKTPVAWNVIQESKPGTSHTVVLSPDFAVCTSDEFGNVTPQLPAVNGQRFDLISSPAGSQLKLSAKNAANKFEIEIYNELPVGSISTMVFRNGLLLAEKTGLGPGQQATFQFYPAISIIVNANVQQGAVIDSSLISESNAMISLLGISSADIVMTGGGSGTSQTPYLFTLQNATYS